VNPGSIWACYTRCSDKLPLSLSSQTASEERRNRRAAEKAKIQAEEELDRQQAEKDEQRRVTNAARGGHLPIFSTRKIEHDPIVSQAKAEYAKRYGKYPKDPTEEDENRLDALINSVQQEKASRYGDRGDI
jgi:hypothetical protein